MKNYRITYRPFAGSTAEASDILTLASDEQLAQAKFEERYPRYDFVSAKEEM